ncbi:MAG: LysM domain-containing protein, partial [Planctomycetaceae bacterium]
HLVTEGDRLDNITARYLGDPTQFWRVCDANLVLLPDELSDEPGESIRIALPRL